MSFEIVDRRASTAADCDVLVIGGGAAGVAAHTRQGSLEIRAGITIDAGGDAEAVASARVTAQCFSYGHAIGHAADMCLEAGCEPRALAGEDVRERVNRDGARLDVGGAA